MGQMALTGLAVAARPAALSAKGDQTGSDKRAFDFELPEAGLEMAGDQGGMFWDFHRHR